MFLFITRWAQNIKCWMFCCCLLVWVVAVKSCLCYHRLRLHDFYLHSMRHVLQYITMYCAVLSVAAILIGTLCAILRQLVG